MKKFLLFTMMTLLVGCGDKEIPKSDVLYKYITINKERTPGTVELVPEFKESYNLLFESKKYFEHKCKDGELVKIHRENDGRMINIEIIGVNCIEVIINE